MQKLIRFGIVGGFGVGWKTIFLLFFVEIINLEESLAVIPTALLVLIHNYEFNRLWTFKNTVPRSWITFRNYAAANGLTLIGYFISFYILNGFMHYLIASWAAVGISAIFNFILANKVFKKPQEI